jgi:hypothetical protein
MLVAGVAQAQSYTTTINREARREWRHRDHQTDLVVIDDGDLHHHGYPQQRLSPDGRRRV